MAKLLGTHTFHSLNEDFPEWAILEIVLPLFAADVPWIASIPESRPPTEAASDEVEFDNLKRKFRIKIGALPGLVPDKVLSSTEFRLCGNRLMPLLKFLESVAPTSVPVANTTVLAADEDDQPEDGKKKKDEKPLQTARVRTWAGGLIPAVLVDAGAAVFSGLSKLVTAAAAYTQAAGTVTSVRRGIALRPTPDTEERTLNIPKLRKLGEFIRKNKGADLVKLCKPHLRLELDLEEFKRAAEDAESIGKLFNTMAISKPPPGGQEVSETNWEELKPRQVSCQLFYLLREGTCRPINKFHEAKLQLDGSLLDSLGDSFRFDIFLSSCPPLPPTHWRQVWYTLVSCPENRTPVADICTTIGNYATPKQPILKMFFREGESFQRGELYWDEPHQDNTPETQETSPTKSLADLLRSGVLLEPICSKDGVFTSGDKAVLALSLSRCLLHFFRGSWMHEIWTARNIHFLHKPADSGDLIYDIHHPYVTCSLATSTAEDPPVWHANDCQIFLSAFAKLLVEIEMGELIDMDIKLPHETFKRKIWQLLGSLERGPRRSEIKQYIQAIHGCINFTQDLTSPHRTGAAWRLDDTLEPAPLTFSPKEVRKVIYNKVVKNLESHFASFPTSTTVLHSDGLFIPKGSIGVTAATPTPQRLPDNRSEHRSIEPEKCFGFSSENTSNVIADVQITAQRATQFSELFKQFRKRFIEPKMKNPSAEVKKCDNEQPQDQQHQGEQQQKKNPRSRIRIALLDTGVSFKDDKLSFEREYVKHYRLEQNFEGQDLDPIKECKSFVGKGKSILDKCGHGTHLALLLLQYAPDADLYIAKVSSDMEFDDTGSVINAIKWATSKEVKADIISMSFGSQNPSAGIHDAIKNSQKTTGATGHTPLLFAAASNHGLLKDASFPGTDANVICVFALDGRGFDVNTFNPPTIPEKVNFGTLGHGIKLSWKTLDKQIPGEVRQESYPEELKSGSSYSTPILAATAANYLAWLDCHIEELGPNRHKLAREKEWVVKIFRDHMSRKQETHSDMHFVVPWKLFQMSWVKDQFLDTVELKKADEKSTRDTLTTIRLSMKHIND